MAVGVLDDTHHDASYYGGACALPPPQTQIKQHHRHDEEDRLWWHIAKRRIDSPASDPTIGRGCHVCVVVFFLHWRHSGGRGIGHLVYFVRVEACTSSDHATQTVLRSSLLCTVPTVVSDWPRLLWELLLPSDLLPVYLTTLTIGVWCADFANRHHDLFRIHC